MYTINEKREKEGLAKLNAEKNVMFEKQYAVQRMTKKQNGPEVETLFRGNFDLCKIFLNEHFGHVTLSKFLELDIVLVEQA